MVHSDSDEAKRRIKNEWISSETNNAIGISIAGTPQPQNK